jgi:hypothetical protein
VNNKKNRILDRWAERFEETFGEESGNEEKEIPPVRDMRMISLRLNYKH